MQPHSFPLHLRNIGLHEARKLLGTDGDRYVSFPSLPFSAIHQRTRASPSCLDRGIRIAFINFETVRFPLGWSGWSKEQEADWTSQNGHYLGQHLICETGLSIVDLWKIDDRIVPKPCPLYAVILDAVRVTHHLRTSEFYNHANDDPESDPDAFAGLVGSKSERVLRADLPHRIAQIVFGDLPPHAKVVFAQHRGTVGYDTLLHLGADIPHNRILGHISTPRLDNELRCRAGQDIHSVKRLGIKVASAGLFCMNAYPQIRNAGVDTDLEVLVLHRLLCLEGSRIDEYRRYGDENGEESGDWKDWKRHGRTCGAPARNVQARRQGVVRNWDGRASRTFRGPGKVRKGKATGL